MEGTFCFVDLAGFTALTEAHGAEAAAVGQPVVIDPVCRMRVQATKAAGRLQHEGVDYWFCSLSCARQFAEDPSAFSLA